MDIELVYLRTNSRQKRFCCEAFIFQRRLDLSKILKNKSFFLFGPRSTGKTTLIETALPQAKVYDLLDDEVFNRLALEPKLIEQEVEDLKKIIVIDEIQKLPKLLDEVHRLIKKDNRTFLLTGSSSRKMRRGGSNLLGGRAWEANLFPLTSAEIPNFDLMTYFQRGGLPHIYPSKNYEEELKSYVNLYLKEEIVVEGLSKKYDYFLRFLDVMALSNGQELNYDQLGSDAQVPPRTLQNYVQVLEDTLMGYQLKPFLKTRTRKAIARSKFFLFDIGVVGKLSKRGLVQKGSPLFGSVFEHFIINEIKAFLSYNRIDEDLCFWRSTSGFEVDCIVGQKLAIEIKSTKLVSKSDLKGLKALNEEKLIKKSIVISMDPTRRQITPEITVYPWQEFLTQLWAGKILDFFHI